MDAEWRQVARVAAFDFVEQISDGGAGPVAYRDLASFSFDGIPIALIGQNGIFKPKVLDYPISIRTASPKVGSPAPYDDEISSDGFLRYRYRGTDPNHWDNAALRRALNDGVAVLYFEGIGSALYQPSGALLIEDDPASLTFTVALTPIASIVAGATISELNETQRRYYLRTVKQRAGQAAFRTQVLTAYRERCTVCTLHHPELLDAAHIIPDSQGGKPVVPNGLAMCKIHHAAFDHNLMGIRPNLVVEVRSDILAEQDGPMLRHGIQELDGRMLLTPRRKEWRPSVDALERRYEEFREAS
ncbi:MAG: HNH endonuclease [Actinomycetota bacterium]|nr:HNH endonuclease [Actinomycetota bacterium]